MGECEHEWRNGLAREQVSCARCQRCAPPKTDLLSRLRAAEERVRELEEEYQEQRAVALDVHNDWCRLRDENKALSAVADAARAATRCEEGALSVLYDKLAALDAAKVTPWSACACEVCGAELSYGERCDRVRHARHDGAAIAAGIIALGEWARRAAVRQQSNGLVFSCSLCGASVGQFCTPMCPNNEHERGTT